MSKLSLKKHGKVKLVNIPCFLANFTDGHGVESTRIGFAIGGEVRFLDDKVLSAPAQSWLRDDILIALGIKEETPKPEVSAASISAAASAQLETQV